MPFIERYLSGAVRVETTTREEQEQTVQMIEESVLAEYDHPFIFYVGPSVEEIRQSRTRTVFLFGLPVHRAFIVDSNSSSTPSLRPKS